ncbi:MAG: NnrS family protein [Robiginitomaculum sp.]|nr:MAG: NnrS family protein [Robiginitomaculum sp.]
MFKHPVLGRGFRPFFILGALQAVFMLVLWGGYYGGYITPPDLLLATTSWHIHEMVYGFAVCVVAGFLLTAVANWTGTNPVKGRHLFVLCCLWVLGRLVMNFDFGLPVWAVYAASIAFLPALAISLSIPLLKTDNKRNFIFLGILGVLSASQICFLVFGVYAAIYVALMMIIMMISLVGGRIIPMFTIAVLKQGGADITPTPQPKWDIAALVSLVVTTACLVSVPDSLLLTASAFIAVFIHLARMRHYHSLRTLALPMLWILHAGYLWVVIGLVLIGLSGAGVVNLTLALHALSTGAVGSLTLGMMTRVALGHTGRNLVASRLTLLSFLLMQIAAILRVFGPMVLPEFSMVWIIGSASVWSFCYFLYLIIYAPILLRARPDGNPA